jgi:hypothetical protein
VLRIREQVRKCLLHLWYLPVLSYAIGGAKEVANSAVLMFIGRDRGYKCQTKHQTIGRTGQAVGWPCDKECSYRTIAQMAAAVSYKIRGGQNMVLCIERARSMVVRVSKGAKETAEKPAVFVVCLTGYQSASAVFE